MGKFLDYLYLYQYLHKNYIIFFSTYCTPVDLLTSAFQLSSYCSILLRMKCPSKDSMFLRLFLKLLSSLTIDRTKKLLHLQKTTTKKNKTPATAKTIKTALQRYDVSTTFFPPASLMAVLNTNKTPGPKHSMCNSIYKIPCNDCNDFYKEQLLSIILDRINIRIRICLLAKKKHSTYKWIYYFIEDQNCTSSTKGKTPVPMMFMYHCIKAIQQNAAKL